MGKLTACGDSEDCHALSEQKGDSLAGVRSGELCLSAEPVTSDSFITPFYI